jgi:hypothetical protein
MVCANRMGNKLPSGVVLKAKQPSAHPFRSRSNRSLDLNPCVCVLHPNHGQIHAC